MLHDVMVVVMIFFFFFNDTATTEIYTLSLHDALPIYPCEDRVPCAGQGHSTAGGTGVMTAVTRRVAQASLPTRYGAFERSEEHTSELQSHSDLVCRLLLEKKKKTKTTDLLPTNTL